MSHGFTRCAFPNNEVVESNSAFSQPSAPVLDDSTVSQLCDMGFPPEACRKAVYYTGNTGIDSAMNWLMGHIDDPGVPSDAELNGRCGSVPLLSSFAQAALSPSFSIGRRLLRPLGPAGLQRRHHADHGERLRGAPGNHRLHGLQPRTSNQSTSSNGERLG